MKKIFLGLAVIIAFIIIVMSIGYAKDGDLFDTGPNHEFRIGSDGNIISKKVDQQIFIDLAASASDYYRLCTVTIATATFVSGGTTWLLANGDYTNSPEARNITIKADFSTGIATAVVVGSGLVTGVDALGNEQTETIVFSTVATLGVGVKAWRSITSIYCTGTVSSAATAIGIAVGTGNVIGLKENVLASGDVVKVIEAGSLTTTATIDYTYNTIDFVTNGNGTYDYEVYTSVINR